MTYATVTALSAGMTETEGRAKHCLTPNGWRSHDGIVKKANLTVHTDAHEQPFSFWAEVI